MVFEPAYRHLRAAELQSRLESGASPTLVDVRTPGEYARYHIPGALLIPVDVLAARCLSELALDGEIVLICEHGVRSEMAARYLASLNYENVATMDGGMAAYQGEVEMYGE